jgi:hypothetical protein
VHCATPVKRRTTGWWVLILFVATGCENLGDSDTEEGSGGGEASTAAAGGGGELPISPLDVAFEAVTVSSAAPTGRWGHVAASLDDQRALVFGGTGSGVENVVHDDLWLFDASDEPPSFVPMAVTAGPAPRYCGCAVYDPERDIVMVVGGRDLTGPLAAETWELDMAQQTWSQVAMESSPPGSIGCATVRSSKNGAIYAFGGGGAGGFDDGTYRYDSSTREWIALDIAGPQARYDAVMRESPDGSLLLFGGANMGASTTYFSDVWRFEPTSESWSLIPMSGMEPPGRRQPWVAAASGGGFYVAFGLQGAQPLADLWLADLEQNSWTLMTGDAAPGARAFTPVLPGGADAAGVLIGGFDGAAPLTDIWRLRFL